MKLWKYVENALRYPFGQIGLFVIVGLLTYSYAIIQWSPWQLALIAGLILFRKHPLFTLIGGLCFFNFNFPERFYQIASLNYERHLELVQIASNTYAKSLNFISWWQLFYLMGSVCLLMVLRKYIKISRTWLLILGLISIVLPFFIRVYVQAATFYCMIFFLHVAGQVLLAWGVSPTDGKDKITTIIHHLQVILSPIHQKIIAPSWQGLNKLKEPDHVKNQVKALKLLVWCRILYFAAEILVWGLFAKPFSKLNLGQFIPSLNLANPYFTSFEKYNSLGIHPLETWLVLILTTLLLIMNHTVSSGIIVGYLRLTGMTVPRNVYRPFEAKSFNDYFRRLLYFYSELLLILFYNPLWKNLLFWKQNNKLKQVLILFITIAFGGWFLHALGSLPLHLYFPASEIIQFYLQWLVYFVILGAISCFSFLPDFYPIPQKLKIVLIIIFQSLALIFFTIEPGDHFAARWEFLINLFKMQ